LKTEIDGFQGAELFETFTEAIQTLICDLLAAVSKSKKIHTRKVTHSPKLRMMDWRELSLPRHSPRVFRP